MNAARRPAIRRYTGVLAAAAAGIATLALVACGGGGGTQVDDTSVSQGDWTWALPLSMPLPKVPVNNPMSKAKVALGRFLFYDRRLSGNGQQSCGDCHLQSLAFTDGRATAIGSTGESHPRNAQGLANVAWNATLTWANPALTDLEQQMLVPLFGTSPVEMGLTNANLPTVLQRLRDEPRYPAMFAAAFPGEADPWTVGNIVRAIASFQRSLVSIDSRYDRWERGAATLTAAELRGLNLFNSERAECFHCHVGFNFNDQVVHAGTTQPRTPFHNTGLYNVDGLGAYPGDNLGLITMTAVASDMGKFRAPSLRNVAVTAPYAHDGSVATLEDVLDNYAAGGRFIAAGQPHAGDGRLNPYKSDLIPVIQLNAQDKADIVAFLRTLTDEAFLSNPDHANPFDSAASAP
ncbi:methanobactin export MATE transporter MbnM [Sphaerotilus mobilis]|uniref:Methanobactin biosynthesis cassette protein MbnH n=1 Tax=Sphaerotilus mobilis TaxID=47994 RepID=A0A4Q7LPT8_9BURK|nr:methanobactin export MATE transporter MbnM [Sphaerotilus mobilis]RZS56775.1 methanobactin biosynthesis cassette protein MbnH [Sphaerotilus mobilis]